MYGRKCGLSRTAKYKRAPESSDEMEDQLVARIASVKEQHTSPADKLQQALHFITLGRIHRDHGSSDGQPSEDIVRGGDKALGIVSFSNVLEAAVGIKLVSDLGCGREVVFGPVHSANRHAVPTESRILGPAVIGQPYRIIEYVLKHVPVDLIARLGECAVVDGFGFRPKATSLGGSKEFTRFHIHPLGLSTGDNGEYESDKLWKREFPLSGEMLR